MTDRTAIPAPRKPASEVLRRPGFPPAFRSAFAPAFTLVELMISIALVVILILGINTVFKYTAQAVGQGQAISTAVRDSRAAQGTMANDFAALVPNGSGATDSASLIIASMAQPAYLNAADKATADGQTNLSTPTSSPDTTPLFIDLNGDGKKGDSSVPGEVISPATYNFRNHRLDTISFFARNKFPRQTGNDGTYVANMSSQEAWVWYGHLWLPNNTQDTQANAFPAIGAAAPSVTYPGSGAAATNPNNYYASQFTLGRMPTLLKTPAYNAADGKYDVLDGGTTPQAFYYFNSGALTLATTYLAPLQFGTSTYINEASTTTQYDTWGTGAGRAFLLQESRNDLAGTSIKTLQNQVLAALAASNTFWWVQSTYAVTGTVYSGTSSLLRYQANPAPPKPLTAARLATSSPIFIPGCTQFIVEFAGDFCTQDNNPAHIDHGTSPGLHSAEGEIVANGPDGTLDYVLVQGNASALDRSKWTKQIMWYGMPRNVSGAVTTNWANGDIAPVRDFLTNNKAAYDASGTGTAINSTTLNNQASFEQVGPTYSVNYTANGGGMSAQDSHNGYICAFGPNDPAPSLIRITMTLNDAAGQLPDGQTYQFVFAVPPQ